MSVAGRFRQLVTSPLKYHVYISRSHDVAINLSIEHYLLQKSHLDSTVLFLYVDKPCIVIGRNQNPWLEVNHALLRSKPAPASNVPTQLNGNKNSHGDGIQIIRRRSGGGTVFHDLGNVNFSVICPQAAFNRDKHAEMVVQAIRKTNPRARVNERHDIVLDPGPLLPPEDRPDPSDTHHTAYAFDTGALLPRKVSGSAYKLTRQRALHHGTCLLSSPNLPDISEYLRSPARPYMKARGVESVRSPVANILGSSTPTPTLTVSAFQHQIVQAFAELYSLDMTTMSLSQGPKAKPVVSEDEQDCASGLVDEFLLDTDEISSGVQEITSPEYLYDQTPQFILSSHPCDEDSRVRPPLPAWFPPSAHIYMKAKSGKILSTQISISGHPEAASSEQAMFDNLLRDVKIMHVDSFWDLLRKAPLPTQQQRAELRAVSRWLNLMLGKGCRG
ncbi:MAG: hypothetical protein Q9220_004040 [cf. Caloplaca sp. 1 TL-2023]